MGSLQRRLEKPSVLLWQDVKREDDLENVILPSPASVTARGGSWFETETRNGLRAWEGLGVRSVVGFRDGAQGGV